MYCQMGNFIKYDSNSYTFEETISVIFFISERTNSASLNFTLPNSAGYLIFLSNISLNALIFS